MTYRYLIGSVGLLFSLTATAGEPTTSASIDASASRYSGTLMFNQASGDLHQQVNARAVSAGELPQIKVEQRLDGIPVDHASAAMQASILGNSFSGGSGVLGVNQSAGAANQQINGFRLGTAITVVTSLPTSAANPFRAVELTDAQLSELRGRYVMPGRIIHFGVTMGTLWENGAGQSLGAQVSFHVDERAQPSLHISELSSHQQETGNGTSPQPGTGAVIGGAGLNDVRGISQSIRSAGDFNDGLNSLEIIVTHGGDAPPSGQTTAWSGSSSFSGAVGQVVLDKQGGGLQILLDAGTQGAALQRIGNGNVIQQANFTGGLNTARNMATLSVALKELPFGQDFANCTLEQLRALRPVGF